MNSSIPSEASKRGSFNSKPNLNSAIQSKLKLFNESGVSQTPGSKIGKSSLIKHSMMPPFSDYLKAHGDSSS